MTILDRFQAIKTIVLDMDGVLTNGQLLVTEEGEYLRSMSIKDGYALQLAVQRGYRIIVISGASSEAGQRRLQRLGISQIYLGIKDKATLLRELTVNLGFALDNTLYMGDDMPDLGAMGLCGLSSCPADACVDVLVAADYISPLRGGQGCVRDVIEKVLKPNGHWG